jgi:hypothetical protein
MSSTALSMPRQSIREYSNPMAFARLGRFLGRASENQLGFQASLKLGKPRVQSVSHTPEVVRIPLALSSPHAYALLSVVALDADPVSRNT